MKRHATLTKMMGIILVACLALGSLALPSRAQESQDRSSSAVEPKSEKRAMTLSLVGTLVSWAMFLPFGLRESHESGLNAGETFAAIGFFAIPVGPALGYFYAGSTGRAFAGIGLRFLGLAALGGAFAVAWNDGSESLVGLLGLTGAVVTIGSTILDLKQVKIAVRRHNEKAGTMRMAIAPIVSPKSKTLGLHVHITF